MQSSQPDSKRNFWIILGFSVVGALIALVGLLMTGSSAFGQEVNGSKLSADELIFVQHPTHCLQFLGGNNFGDSVSYEYSDDLELALFRAKSKSEVEAVFGRLHMACYESVARRAYLHKLAERTD
jgi:hypothetical protein